jgi:hypothetical protein
MAERSSWAGTASDLLRAASNLAGEKSAGGGSFAVRQLYTDDDEVLFQAARPLLVNGIEDVISRADLADRGIFLTLAGVGLLSCPCW